MTLWCKPYYTTAEARLWLEYTRHMFRYRTKQHTPHLWN